MGNGESSPRRARFPSRWGTGEPEGRMVSPALRFGFPSPVKDATLNVPTLTLWGNG
ncbi:hypothetical protein NIES4075_13000 [Tolypothrix sp. NIES-4075]|uniref:hypothetical protein n=1 Tax=Tolypothrix sp. NIES-4075 TaxID=2005459 RepID=UPI000B7259FA|nr:hypothetical protein [Tolypothrix sp. NIES-4075]GAX40336.1 hypothetical protein NIES4075_13000 [Tolypothrix sp. NIES-4075]